MDVKRGLKSLLVISILSIALFAYLTYIHYSPGESKFCDISEGVSCDIVNKSIYSEIFGIPVSLLGLLTFLVVYLLAYAALKKKGVLFGLHIGEKEILEILLLIVVIGVLFSLWLVYAELYLILSICLLCVVADILILASLFILIELNKKNIRHSLIWISILLSAIVSIIIIYLIYRIIIEI